jgi:D-alanyl-D-alanine carboxypeptidase/D-alanyl-D-alanine-endopeptidase (penicillin-binding protein 4)
MNAPLRLLSLSIAVLALAGASVAEARGVPSAQAAKVAAAKAPTTSATTVGSPGPKVAGTKTVATKTVGTRTVATKTAAKRGGKKAEPKVRPAPRTLTATAALPAPARAQIEAALNDEDLDGADVGLVVVDLDSGDVLAESGADLLINPASNDKMITSAAALAVLKPEYRFKTEYFVRGTLKDGTLTGDLVVKGYGDPSVVSERLVRIANELFLFGIEKITGSVVVDDSWFDDVEEARGWEQEDAPDRAYAAPVSALNCNFNAVAVYVRPGARAGEPAIVAVDPPTERVTLKGTVLTEAVGRGVRLNAEPDLDDGVRRPPRGQPAPPGRGTLLTIDGSVGLRDSPDRLYRRVWDPALHFGSVLTTLLQQRGVQMRHNVVHGAVPAGARLVLVDKSPPLKEIVDDLNHYSNNIIAEVLVKAMGAEVMGAPGTFANGLAVGRRYLEEQVGLQPGTYQYENGSGLNDVNRFSARQLAQLVRTVAADYEIATEWFTSLAVAGTQGTIGHRMKDTPAQRRLRAKTGTLRSVSALSGTVVQPSGNVLAFSILTQGYKKGASSVWKVQNAIGAALASDGTWNPDATTDDSDAEVAAANSGTPPPIEMTANGG